MIHVRKFSIIFTLLTVFLVIGAMASTSLVVYSNFALVQSDVFKKSSNSMIIPTTNGAVKDSLVVSAPFDWYKFHQGERYSLSEILRSYLGKTIEFKFKDGTLKTIRVVSVNPVILQEPQTGKVFFSPLGEYIFPSLPSLDSKNYFVVSTSATDIVYRYISSNIGWKAVYDLDLDTSKLNGCIVLWNKTDMNFKDFNLTFVAGKPNVEMKRKAEYSKAITLNAAPGEFTPPNQDKNMEGYKVYDFGSIKSLRSNSDISIPLFSKKVKVEKLNVSYNPNSNFETVNLVARIQHDFPIPQGVVSLYKKSSGVKYFIGESSVVDSPASATLDIPYGKIFDVEVKNVRTQRSLIAKNVYLYKYQVTIRNSSNKKQGVWIYEYVPDGSDVQVNGANMKRISSNEVRFYLDVERQREGTFNYSVQTSY